VHTGVLLLAVAVGFAFIVTGTVTVAVHPHEKVTVNVYVPDAAVEMLLIDGFCLVDENPFGPVHE
jgi:hypothetical protein